MKEKKLGTLGRQHVQQNYNFTELQDKWVEVIDKIIEQKGNYNGIRFKEVA